MNAQQAIFVDEYCRHRNASRAARAAGYRSPRNSGSRLLKRPEIKSEIESRTQQHLAERNIDKQWVLDRIVAEVERAQQSGTKSQTALKGLELIAKHLGMFVEKTEISFEATMLEGLAQRMIEGQARVLEAKAQKSLPESTDKVQ